MDPRLLSLRVGVHAVRRARGLRVAPLGTIVALIILGAGTWLPAQERAQGPAPAPGSARTAAPAMPAVPRRGTAGLLAQAVKDGKVDAETALVYEVFAAFGDARLPAQFKGDDAGVSHSRGVRRAAAAFDRLSPRGQALIGPFLVPPYYQGSWWDLRERASPNAPGTSPGAAGSPAGSGAAPGRASPSPSTAASAPPAPPCTPRQDCALSPNWEWLDTRNGKVRVWWRRGLAHGSRTQAEAIAAAIDGEIWPKLTGLMGEPISDSGVRNNGGSGRLDIVLVWAPGGMSGMAVPYHGCRRTPAFLLVHTPNRETLAHELMHAIQFRYDLAWDCDEYHWLAEATAEWAIDYVYPTGNSEHRRAAEFLREPERPLEQDDGVREYGAYVFFFYLARQVGPSVVRAIWDNAARVDSLAAIDDAIGGFDVRWPEFAVHNWNRRPLDHYVQWDRLAAHVDPQQERVRLGLVPDRIHHMLEGEGIKHLAAHYYHYRFGDDDVRTVGFHNGYSFRLGRGTHASVGEYFEATPLSADQRRGAGVRALVKLEGQDWQVQDWTDDPFRAFCRDMRAERLEELVLIYTNSRHDDRDLELRPQGEPPALWVSNMGCWRWHGPVSHVHGGPGIHSNWTGEVTFERVRQAGPLIYYRQVAGQVAYHYDVTSGDCRYEGNGTAGVLRNFDLGHSYNYVISGAEYRKVGLVATPDGAGTYTYLCPDGPPRPGTSAFAGVQTTGAGDQGEVTRDGTTVEGRHETLTGHVDEWRLEAQRE